MSLKLKFLYISKSKQNVFSTDNESIVPLIYIIILDMLSREIYKVLEVPIPMNVIADEWLTVRLMPH